MADSRPNRTPEVVVFSEPTRDFNEQKSGGRRKFVQKRSNILRGGGDGGEFFSLNPEQEDSKETDLGEADLFVRLDMRTALKEVKSLCGEGLVGKEKRRYEEQRAKELGGKGHKAPVMPYPVYMKVQQRRREKEKEKMEEMREQGMAVGKKKRAEKVFKGRGRWKDNIKGLNPYREVGRLKNGVLSVNPRRQSTMNRGRQRR